MRKVFYKYRSGIYSGIILGLAIIIWMLINAPQPKNGNSNADIQAQLSEAQKLNEAFVNNSKDIEYSLRIFNQVQDSVHQSEIKGLDSKLKVRLDKTSRVANIYKDKYRKLKLTFDSVSETNSQLASTNLALTSTNTALAAEITRLETEYKEKRKVDSNMKVPNLGTTPQMYANDNKMKEQMSSLTEPKEVMAAKDNRKKRKSAAWIGSYAGVASAGKLNEKDNQENSFATETYLKGNERDYDLRYLETKIKRDSIDLEALRQYYRELKDNEIILKGRDRKKKK